MQTIFGSWSASLFFLAALVGAVMSWLWSRVRTATAIERAIADKASELLMATERLNHSAQECERQKNEIVRLQNESSQLNELLDNLREQRAQLEVHAGRIPQLEKQLATVQEEYRTQSERLIEITHAHGQKACEVAELGERLRQRASELQNLTAEYEVCRAEARRQGESLAELASKNDSLTLALSECREALSVVTEQRNDTQAEARKQAEKLAELATTLAAERTQTEEKLVLLHEAKDQLKSQFENLANRIFEEKGEKFAKQNQENLGALLTPLNEKIKSFQEQVAQTYDKDSKERLTLKNEIERLAILNTQMSSDAVSLTQALKGSNKAQGIWGEMVLERVLETSGLTKGREYTVQESRNNEEGTLQRPDVVIYLPEEKHLVIDSKMSLLAYERHCSAETEDERQMAARDHLASVRSHIKGLSAKNYQALHGLKSLDFVLMFIPVEPAFMIAANGDGSLFNDAFSKNVLLVSPSTLLATLRTIASIWRQEHQNQNAQAIADHCSKLYDKFVGFVENVDEIGRRIEQTHKAYSDARGKLVSGRGNLIRQVEKIRELGVKPSKEMPSTYIADADDSGDTFALVA